MLQNEIDAFAQDGVVVLRGFFKEWIELLEKGVENNEQHPGQWFRDYTVI